MKYLFLFSFFLLFCLLCLGQDNTANIWYFGGYSGLDFNSGVPTAINNGQINTGEGCASICDATGELLFYTEGTTVWNKNHAVMQNGTGLMGNWSASQSSIIVPYPQNDSLYIIFTIDARENNLANGLRYSIVNMNLDSGLGGVTSTKNVLLHTPMSEKLTLVIKPNQTDFWVLAHEWGTDAFLAYSVTNAGVDPTPVTSNVGGIHTGGIPSRLHAIGCMKANLNGNLIAVANYRNTGYFELFDFSAATGIVSNVRTSASTFYRPYGVEFSPEGDYLYGSIDGAEYTDGKLYQFDLSLPNPLTSPVLVGNSPKHIGTLQIAPNGKIFASCRDQVYISYIDKPDAPGMACNFIHNGIFLEGGTTDRGLPLLYFCKGFEFFTGSNVDTSICDGDSIYLGNYFQTQAGIYQDILISSQGWDSIINTTLSLLPVPGTPPLFDNSGILSTIVANGYQWYLNGSPIAGANAQSYTPFVSGYYQIEVFNSYGCSSISDVYYYDTNDVPFPNEPEYGIFPNPCNEKLIIRYDEAFSCELFDISGSLLERFQPENKHEIDMNKYPAGIYLLKILNNQGIRSVPVIKE